MTRPPVGALLLCVSILCPLDGQTANVDVARAVYAAAIDRLLRAEPADSVVVLDSTIPVPSFVMRSADERHVSDGLREVIASTAATALPTLDNASVARITKAQFHQMKREVPTPRYRTQVAVVSLSAVFVDHDGERALVYVERWQGPNWSSGGVMQLERDADHWVIISEWGRWAT